VFEVWQFTKVFFHSRILGQRFFVCHFISRLYGLFGLMGVR
jgi:hypothetical protein